MRKFKNFNGSDYITDHVPFSGWTALGQLIDAHGFDKAVVRSRTFNSVFQQANEIGSFNENRISTRRLNTMK